MRQLGVDAYFLYMRDTRDKIVTIRRVVKRNLDDL